jgi:uncharacterized protein YneF (UPF0154 family)
MTIIASIIAFIAGLFLGYHWGRRDEREDNPPVPDRTVSPQAGGGPGVPE